MLTVLFNGCLASCQTPFYYQKNHTVCSLPLKKEIMKSKLIIEKITIPNGTNPTTTSVDVTIDANYRHLVGVAMFESSNPNNVEFLVGVSKGGNAIIPPTPRALYKAEHASPDQKFKSVAEYVDISKVEVNTTLRVASGADPIVFDVILEFQDQE